MPVGALLQGCLIPHATHLVQPNISNARPKLVLHRLCGAVESQTIAHDLRFPVVEVIVAHRAPNASIVDLYASLESVRAIGQTHLNRCVAVFLVLIGMIGAIRHIVTEEPGGNALLRSVAEPVVQGTGHDGEFTDDAQHLLLVAVMHSPSVKVTLAQGLLVALAVQLVHHEDRVVVPLHLLIRRIKGTATHFTRPQRESHLLAQHIRVPHAELVIAHVSPLIVHLDLNASLV